mmetsp:Transcript_59329/g.162785  ORF Transcript_59329/g.162785 Transcript_59329/m.162785 type:complete len:212 (+) Transcript_59329:1712-2347(+)
MGPRRQGTHGHAQGAARPDGAARRARRVRARAAAQGAPNNQASLHGRGRPHGRAAARQGHPAPHRAAAAQARRRTLCGDAQPVRQCALPALPYQPLASGGGRHRRRAAHPAGDHWSGLAPPPICAAHHVRHRQGLQALARRAQAARGRHLLPRPSLDALLAGVGPRLSARLVHRGAHLRRQVHGEPAWRPAAAGRDGGFQQPELHPDARPP